MSLETKKLLPKGCVHVLNIDDVRREGRTDSLRLFVKKEFVYECGVNKELTAQDLSAMAAHPKTSAELQAVLTELSAAEDPTRKAFVCFQPLNEPCIAYALIAPSAASRDGSLRDLLTVETHFYSVIQWLPLLAAIVLAAVCMLFLWPFSVVAAVALAACVPAWSAVEWRRGPDLQRLHQFVLEQCSGGDMPFA